MKNKGLLFPLLLLFAVIIGLLLYYVDINQFFTEKKQEQKEVTRQSPEKQAEPKPEKQEKTVKKGPSLQEQFDSAVAYADSLFEAETYRKAKDAYIKSLQIMEDPYPYKRVRKIEKILRELAQKKQEKEAKKEKKGVFVKGGNFTMRLQLKNDSIIERKVTVKDFHMSKHEVTVAEYRKFCEENNREMPKEPRWGWEENAPIVNVSWHDAMDYAKWAGKRLPTNAEWHYAAMGGHKAKEYKYSGGNDLDKVGWYWKNSEKKTHPVGSKKPNELGVYDMTGNAWEWCKDWYNEDYLINASMDNPQGPEGGKKKMLRGGSWYSYKEYCELSYLSNGGVDYKYLHIGFRLVW